MDDPFPGSSGTHAHSSVGEPVEVGTYFSLEEVRGIAEFDLTGQAASPSTTLSFVVNELVYSFAHFDRQRHVLYVFDLDRWIYRITPEKISKVENGTDGVLFIRSPKYQPFEIGTPKGDPTYWTTKSWVACSSRRGSSPLTTNAC